MTTALITDDRFLEHENPAWHPESPARLRAIMHALETRGMLTHPDIVRRAPRLASDDDLLAIHTPEHLAKIIAAARAATSDHPVPLDPDTFVGQQSEEIARLAAGAVLVGVDAVLREEAANAFALVRPPGHHAEPDAAMGFCLYNNIAVAARYAQRVYGIEKVLICDFDVHHGNGTQAAFYADPTVAYFSTHQSPFYPGTGAFDEIGVGEARYTTCNAPVPRNATLELYDAIYREVFVPFCDRFQPDLILLSAGYDTHWRDPMANILLDTPALALLTLRVYQMAETYCAGRLVGVLEGGYDMEALADGVCASLNILLGDRHITDSLGSPPWPGFRWNADVVVDELRQAQDLFGYRRKTRPAGPIPGMPDIDEDHDEPHPHDEDED